MSLFTSKKKKKIAARRKQSDASSDSLNPMDLILGLLDDICKGNGTKQDLDDLVSLALGEGYKVDHSFPVEHGGEALIIKVKNICLNYRPEILKLAKPGILQDTNKRIRFLRGAALQGKLSEHLPFSVPQVYTPNWEPTFVRMQYIKGTSLLEFAAENDELDIIKIFLKILRIVGIAHQHNIIHRDLKVTNFMVVKSVLTGCKEPVMLDYGLAKKSDSEDHLTNVGMQLGTPAFSPPEQIGQDADAKNADALSDIYSLGQMLYVLLTFKEHDIPQNASEYDADVLKGKYIEVYKYATNPRETRYTTTSAFYHDLLESVDLDEDEVDIHLQEGDLEDSSKYDSIRRSVAPPKKQDISDLVKTGKTAMPTQRLPQMPKQKVKINIKTLFPDMAEHELYLMYTYLKLQRALAQLDIDLNEVDFVFEDGKPANVCADEKDGEEE